MAKQKEPKTDEELRKDLEVAKEAYARSNTYYNAVAIQSVENQLQVRADQRRKSFKVIQGDAGSHDLTDVEVYGKALKEIHNSIRSMERDADIPGTLLHIYNVSKQALMATGKLSE